MAEPSPAERRRISVLFVDLENFTSLAETLDPEEVRGVQSRYFEVARSIVASHGGTIEKFIGDAVMAVWGAPLAHEDDPERAVRAAMAIVDGVGRLGGAASGANLAARAAVTTGEAAVTLGADGQGMVAGDLVNVAARLQGEARARRGAGRFGDSGAGPAGGRFEAAGTIALKGRSASLVAASASPTSAPGSGGEGGAHAGAFVGRERELRELVESLRQRRRAIASAGWCPSPESRGSGRAGWRGSSASTSSAMTDDVAWHAGRAPAYGEGITFAAVAEMVRRRIRVSDDASPTIARRQLCRRA